MMLKPLSEYDGPPWTRETVGSGVIRIKNRYDAEVAHVRPRYADLIEVAPRMLELLRDVDVAGPAELNEALAAVGRFLRDLPGPSDWTGSDR